MIRSAASHFRPQLISALPVPALKSSGPLASPRQTLFTSASLRDFRKDILFGTRDPHHTIFNQVKTEEFALEIEHSGDYPVLTKTSPAGSTDTKKAHAAYIVAHGQLRESGELPGWPKSRIEPDQRAWDALAFIPGIRSHYLKPACRYVDFSQAAIKTALDRKGQVGFHLGNFCLHRHFIDAMAVEGDHGTTFPAFLKTATMGMLLKDERPVAESTAGMTTAPKAVPTFTSVELGDFMEGESSEVPVTYFSSRGLPLDTEKFAALYGAAKGLTRSEENRTCLSETGKFLPEATRAVEDFQTYVHGFAKPLPDAAAVWRGHDFGGDPEKWPVAP